MPGWWWVWIVPLGLAVVAAISFTAVGAAYLAGMIFG